MWGRFTQYRAQVRYLERLNWQAPLAFEPSDEPIARYNVAPSTRVQLLHWDDDGLKMSEVPWGYAPQWARTKGNGKKKHLPAINTKIESAPSSPYWRAAWKQRCLVAADGWYEWVTDPADKKHKQPY